jgi:hypothetical protein
MEPKWTCDFDPKNCILKVKVNYMEGIVLKEKELIFYLNFDNVLRLMLDGVVAEVSKADNNKKQ